MTQFAEEVNEKTDGRIQVKIFPNGQLGSENENLEQLQAGVIAMTKVSAPGLATYNEAYNAFGLPYIFNDTISTMSWTRRRCRTSSSRPARTALSR
jgi:TRAP-type C4-dicarboxylate transport system substrate-binding protein